MNNHLKLITENIDIQSLEYLSEGEGSNKVFKIKGPMIECEITNGNKRIYPIEYGDREVNKFMSFPPDKRLGEWEHPLTPTINRERCAVLIESLEKNGNSFIGTAKVLTKWVHGRIIQNSLEEGFPVGMSTRSLGTVNESNRRVNKDWNLITIDSVSTPSGPNCFVEGILENKEYIISGDLITEIAVHNLQKKLDKKGSKEISKYLKEFINDIGKGK